VQCAQLARGARPLPALQPLAASAARALARALTLRNPCPRARHRAPRSAHGRAAAHGALLGAAAHRRALQEQPRHRGLLLGAHASDGAPTSLLLLLLPLPPLLLVERICVTPRGSEGRPGLRVLTGPHELTPQQQRALRHAHLGVKAEASGHTPQRSY
jgi:hypothetical protein